MKAKNWPQRAAVEEAGTGNGSVGGIQAIPECMGEGKGGGEGEGEREGVGEESGA